MARVLSALIIGLVFGSGIALSGMANPAKVLNFFDFVGTWDPSLAFVMGGGMTTYAVARLLILKRGVPVLGGSFPTFPKSKPDGRLIGGAALFGIGWGLGGWCPGPALASIGAGASHLLLFVGAMVAGMGIFRVWEQRRVAQAGAVEPICPT